MHLVDVYVHHVDSKMADVDVHEIFAARSFIKENEKETPTNRRQTKETLGEEGL